MVEINDDVRRGLEKARQERKEREESGGGGGGSGSSSSRSPSRSSSSSGSSGSNKVSAAEAMAYDPDEFNDGSGGSGSGSSSSSGGTSGSFSGGISDDSVQSTQEATSDSNGGETMQSGTADTERPDRSLDPVGGGDRGTDGFGRRGSGGGGGEPEQLDAAEAVTFSTDDPTEGQIRNIENRARAQAEPGDQISIVTVGGRTAAFVGPEAGERAEREVQQQRAEAVGEFRETVEESAGREVQTGEITFRETSEGGLRPVFAESLEDDLERQHRLRQEQAQAMAYPSVEQQSVRSQLESEFGPVDDPTGEEERARAEQTSFGLAPANEDVDAIDRRLATSRGEARQSIEAQLEEQTGADLDEDDIEVTVEDGQMVGRLSDEGERQVARETAMFGDVPVVGGVFQAGAETRVGLEQRFGDVPADVSEGIQSVLSVDLPSEADLSQSIVDAGRERVPDGTASRVRTAAGALAAGFPAAHLAATGPGQAATESAGEGVDDALSRDIDPDVMQGRTGLGDVPESRADADVRGFLDSTFDEFTGMAEPAARRAALGSPVGIVATSNPERVMLGSPVGLVGASDRGNTLTETFQESQREFREMEDRPAGGFGAVAPTPGVGRVPAAARAGAAIVGGGVTLGATGFGRESESELEVPDDPDEARAVAELPVPEGETTGELPVREPTETELEMPDSPADFEVSEVSIPDQQQPVDPSVVRLGQQLVIGGEVLEEDDAERLTITEGDIITDLPDIEQPGPSVREQQRRDDLFTPERTRRSQERAEQIEQDGQERIEQAERSEVLVDTDLAVGEVSRQTPRALTGVDVTQAQEPMMLTDQIQELGVSQRQQQGQRQMQQAEATPTQTQTANAQPLEFEFPSEVANVNEFRNEFRASPRSPSRLRLPRLDLPESDPIEPTATDEEIGTERFEYGVADPDDVLAGDLDGGASTTPTTDLADADLDPL